MQGDDTVTIWLRPSVQAVCRQHYRPVHRVFMFGAAQWRAHPDSIHFDVGGPSISRRTIRDDCVEHHRIEEVERHSRP